jgi:PadR family transcriptional regulator, regulatory protein PadR
MPTKQEKPQHPIDNLGQFEAWVLTATVTLGPERAYGMTIHEEVERLSKRLVVSLGAIYTTLERLERKGLVKSWYADATTDRGGRPRRYFQLEAAGQRALNEALAQSAAMASALRTAEDIA